MTRITPLKNTLLQLLNLLQPPTTITELTGVIFCEFLRYDNVLLLIRLKGTCIHWVLIKIAQKRSHQEYN